MRHTQQRYERILNLPYQQTPGQPPHPVKSTYEARMVIECYLHKLYSGAFPGRPALCYQRASYSVILFPASQHSSNYYCSTMPCPSGPPAELSARDVAYPLRTFLTVIQRHFMQRVLPASWPLSQTAVPQPSHAYCVFRR